MNIGIFTDTYYPEINGVANSSYELKKGLEKMGHKVYVFTVTNPNAEELEEDVFRMPSIPNRMRMQMMEPTHALMAIMEVMTMTMKKILTWVFIR